MTNVAISTRSATCKSFPSFFPSLPIEPTTTSNYCCFNHLCLVSYYSCISLRIARKLATKRRHVFHPFSFLNMSEACLIWLYSSSLVTYSKVITEYTAQYTHVLMVGYKKSQANQITKHNNNATVGFFPAVPWLGPVITGNEHNLTPQQTKWNLVRSIMIFSSNTLAKWSLC